MAKMGYIIGTGLGPNGEGRVEPVSAYVYPQGVSLGEFICGSVPVCTTVIFLCALTSRDSMGFYEFSSKFQDTPA